MKITSLMALRLAAVLVLSVALLWTALTVRYNFRLERKITTMRETLNQLADLRKIDRQRQAIRRACESWTAGEQASMPAIALSILKSEETQPAIGNMETQNLSDGWMVKKVEVVFAEIEFGRLAQFLYAAETQRPPWRLAECTLVSSSQKDAAGRAQLIMETLARSSH